MVDTKTALPLSLERLQLLRVLLAPPISGRSASASFLVGEYMGWNSAVGKGGMIAGLIALLGGRPALHLRGDDLIPEVTSTVAAAGGQYARAKLTLSAR